ncbi:MAG: sugar ABC transporter permease [Clostridia bacterium]|nr:sugar ABC transporter permease [Clostridia bacterium]
MDQETRGTVCGVYTQWWLKIKTKPVRLHAMDGATFPHVIKVQYTVEDRTYTKWKWVPAHRRAPVPGEVVTVLYDKEKPAKGRIVGESGYRGNL